MAQHRCSQRKRKIQTLLCNEGIPHRPGFLIFPERSVLLIKANRDALEQLLIKYDSIAEYHHANDLLGFEELDNIEQSYLADGLLERMQFTDSDISLCILDTGINNGHPLLKPVLKDSDRHSLNPNWGLNDDTGHGTKMVGIAIYGDLAEKLLSNNPIRISHCLESVKMIASGNPKANPKELWGYITQQCVSRAEIKAPERKRISSSPITAEIAKDNAGKPTSWSAAIDQLCYGIDELQHKRLLAHFQT